MRTRITQLEPEDPRNKVGLAGAAMDPEHVAALRWMLRALEGDAGRIRQLLASSSVEDRDLPAWTRAALEGLRQFVALTAPRHGRLPFVMVGSLTDERTFDDRIRQPIEGEEGSG